MKERGEEMTCTGCNLYRNGKCEISHKHCVRRKMQDVDYSHKCGACKFLDLEDESILGFRCVNPEKNWKYKSSAYHYKTTKACSLMERRTK